MTKIVIWATNEKEEKQLLTLELKPKENKVEICSIPEKDVNDQLEADLIGKWKKNEAVEFPATTTKIDRPLSISESVLPDNIKVEKGGDLIRRARTEWPVIVLSYKLNDLYENELGDIKTKVDSLSAFSGDVFDELKGFWGKVQGQIRDRSLLRTHSESLKETTNELFDSLKKMRASLDKEYRSASADLKKTFNTQLDEIEAKIETGRFSAIFDELKKIQNEFKSGKFTKGDRTQLWNRIDGAFKKIKEKKYGANADSGGNRLQKRYDGLLTAMDKMEQSIGRDKNDLNFQNKRINNADGQLEAQLREAKLLMIEERIRSKEEKLADMQKTKAELETKLEAQKLKEAKREKEKEIKAKIAEDIKSKQEARAEDAPKLTALGNALSTAKVQGSKPAAPAAPVTPVAPVAPTAEKVSTPTAEVKAEASADDSFTHAVNTAIAVNSIKSSEEE